MNLSGKLDNDFKIEHSEIDWAVLKVECGIDAADYRTINGSSVLVLIVPNFENFYNIKFFQDQKYAMLYKA